MNELKIGVDDREAFEGKLRAAGGLMGDGRKIDQTKP